MYPSAFAPAPLQEMDIRDSYPYCEIVWGMKIEFTGWLTALVKT